jgi:hypothetical protein
MLTHPARPSDAEAKGEHILALGFARWCYLGGAAGVAVAGASLA